MRARAVGLQILILAALLMGLSSCASPQAISEVATSTPAVVGKPSTGQKPGTAREQGTALGDLSAGLEQQNNYRAEFRQDISGEMDGKPFERHTHLAINRDSGRVDFLQEVNSSEGSDGYARVIDLGQALYRWQSPAQPCQGTAGEPEEGEVIEPAEYLLPVRSATEVGLETVNGIPTRHYRFDQGSFANGEAGTASGDVWLAETDGIVVKYSLAAAAPAKPDAAGQKLAQKWVYEWQPIEPGQGVALPGGCIEVPLDLPMLNDAQNTAYSSGMVTYSSNMNPLEAANFYLQKLPEMGWTSPLEALKIEPRLPIAAVFTSPDQHLSVTIEAGEPGGLSITLFLSAAPTQDNAVSDNQSTAAPARPEPTTDPSSSGLPADIPLYPGASGRLNVPGSVFFNAPDTPDVVAKFYREQMIANGWSLENEVSAESTTSQTWKKAERSVTINTGLSEKVTYVVVAGR